MKTRTLILALLLTLSATAQQTVRGTVTDDQSSAPLPGVTVIVAGSEPLIGTSTDMDGRFVLNNIPVGRTDLQFSFISYESRSLTGVLVSRDRVEGFQRWLDR
jgi:hypothetical protein